MISYNDVTKGNINKYNLNWPRIPDHPIHIQYEQLEALDPEKRLHYLF